MKENIEIEDNQEIEDNENKKIINISSLQLKNIKGNNDIKDNFFDLQLVDNNLNQIRKHKEKQRIKRVVTETIKWNFTPEELEYSNQLKILNSLELININSKNIKDKSQSLIYSQIKIKLRSYKEQDIKKNIYDYNKFITFEFIISKLKQCSMICFYCKQSVNILYEYVREPRQWTVERINNHYGHNNDNVEIACLTCNVRRKTMYFERYISTKQLCGNIIKME